MRKAFVLASIATSLASAVVPHSFSSGQPAKAQEVNENFISLDTALQKKASQATVDVIGSSLLTKADNAALESLRSKVASDSSALMNAVDTKANNADVMNLLGAKTDTSAFAALEKTVAGKQNALGYTPLNLAGGSVTGNIGFADNHIYFRGLNDSNHQVGYVATWAGTAIDGPILCGASGGALGTFLMGGIGEKLALRWDNSGNVTIPGKLTTQAAASFGDVHIAGSLVTNPGATPADYVFEPDYKLSSLSEVAAFTQANKHLPEVPSAAEMTTNGVDLAKMNMILLKKVEELTLHAIAQEKRLDAQQKLIDELGAQHKAP